jgi:hypothetical protein
MDGVGRGITGHLPVRLDEPHGVAVHLAHADDIAPVHAEEPSQTARLAGCGMRAGRPPEGAGREGVDGMRLEGGACQYDSVGALGPAEGVGGNSSQRRARGIIGHGELQASWALA